MSTPGPPMTVFITIGNVDDALTSRGWATFHDEVAKLIDMAGGVFQGEWFCTPLPMRQTACWCVDIQPGIASRLAGELGALGTRYGRGMVGWNVVSESRRLG